MKLKFFKNDEARAILKTNFFLLFVEFIIFFGNLPSIQKRVVTFSLTFFKLSQGILIKVCPALIKRSKTHFHNLPCGASIILGKNGFVWISPTTADSNSSGGFAQNLDQVNILFYYDTLLTFQNCNFFPFHLIESW